MSELVVCYCPCSQNQTQNPDNEQASDAVKIYRSRFKPGNSGFDSVFADFNSSWFHSVL